MYVRYEPVPALGDRLNIWAVVAFLAESLPQQEHRFREIPFLDESVRPDTLEQSLAVQQPAIVLYKLTEQVEYFGRERHGASIPQQNFFRRVEEEGAELVHHGGRKHAEQFIKKKAMGVEGSLRDVRRALEPTSLTSTEYLLRVRRRKLNGFR